MARTSRRRPSAARLVVAITVMAGFAAGVVAPSGSALAPSKKLAAESLDIHDSTDATTVQSGISGKSAPLASSTTYTFHFTITNDQHSPQAYGSFEIAVPTGFVIANPTAINDSGASMNPATDVSGTGAGPILVTTNGPTGSGVLQTKSTFVTVTVTTPASAGCNTTWATEVKQSNDFSGSGNDFNVNSVSTPTTGSDSLVWTVDAADVQVKTPMVNSAVSPASAPKVSVLDPCGHVDTSYNQTITATDASTDPADTPTAISFAVAASAGVATFPAISYTNYGYDHTLQATAPGTQCNNTCDSALFHVYQVLVPCSTDGTTTCGTKNPVFDGGNTTGLTVTGGADKTPANLTIDVAPPNVDLGTCNQPTNLPLEPAIGKVVSLNVGTRTKTGVLEITKNFFNQNPNNGTPFMDICLDVPANTLPTFQDKFGQTVPRTVTIGTTTTTYTSGLLQDCSTLVGPPCVSNRKKNAGNEFITFTLPAGDPRLGGY